MGEILTDTLPVAKDFSERSVDRRRPRLIAKVAVNALRKIE